MIFSMTLFVKFLIGIFKRLRNDAYYRSLGILTLIVVVIATVFVWLVGGWPFLEALLYAVATMSMNTPFGPLSAASGPELRIFHMAYTFISVGVFITFTLETGKTMLAARAHSHRDLWRVRPHCGGWDVRRSRTAAVCTPRRNRHAGGR